MNVMNIYIYMCIYTCIYLYIWELALLGGLFGVAVARIVEHLRTEKKKVYICVYECYEYIYIYICVYIYIYICICLYIWELALLGGLLGVTVARIVEHLRTEKKKVYICI